MRGAGWRACVTGALGGQRVLAVLSCQLGPPRALHVPRYACRHPFASCLCLPAVLGDMCQQGLLNVYALAEALVEQDSKRFMTTIQVSGWWVGGLALPVALLGGACSVWGVQPVGQHGRQSHAPCRALACGPWSAAGTLLMSLPPARPLPRPLSRCCSCL